MVIPKPQPCWTRPTCNCGPSDVISVQHLKNLHQTEPIKKITSMQVSKPNTSSDKTAIPESDRLYLNVGGTVFIMSRYALTRYPYTRLGRLAMTSLQELHFDRNPKLMSYILDLYRTGQLHVPRNCCSNAMKCEMIFWEIPVELVSECCWTLFEEGDRYQYIIDDIETTLKEGYDTTSGHNQLFDHIWNTMSNPSYSRTAKIWNYTYNFFVALTSISFILESYHSHRHITDKVKSRLVGPIPEAGDYRFLMYSVEDKWVYVLDTLCWTFFTVEFFIRFTVSPNKVLFLRSKLNIMDIVLLAAVWIIFFTKDMFDEFNDVFFYTRVTMNSLKAMRVLRIFTVLYRNEYTKVMLLSLNASAHPLSLLMLSALMAALIFGSLIYLVEVFGNSRMFQNVFKATWWGYETMTAIGYGSIVPKTVPGYLIGVCCGMFGMIVFAMPIAIMSESFQQYMVGLRTYRHRLVRVKYRKNQGMQNAFRAIRMFWYQPEKMKSTTGDKGIASIV